MEQKNGPWAIPHTMLPCAIDRACAPSWPVALTQNTGQASYHPSLLWETVSGPSGAGRVIWYLRTQDLGASADSHLQMLECRPWQYEEAGSLASHWSQGSCTRGCKVMMLQPLPELRNNGAQPTVKQVSLYSSNKRFFCILFWNLIAWNFHPRVLILEKHLGP